MGISCLTAVAAVLMPPPRVLPVCSAGRRPGTRILHDLPKPGDGGCQLVERPLLAENSPYGLVGH